MAGTQPGGALGDGCGQGLDPDTQIREEALDDGDRVRAASPGVDQYLGVRTGGNDQLLAACPTDRLDGRRVVRVLTIEKRDDNARVENDYRHSRRSVRRDPLG